MASDTSSKTGAEPGGRRWSIVGRVTVWYAASMIVLMLLAFALVHHSLETMLASQVDRSLAEKIAVVRKLVQEHPQDIAELREEVEWEWSANAYVLVWLRVIDPDAKRVIAETPGMVRWATPDALPAPLPASARLEGAVSLSAPGGGMFRALCADAPLGGGRPGSRWVIQALIDFSHDTALMKGYWHTIGSVMGLMVCVSIPLGWYLARGTLRSVAAVSREIARMDSSTLHLRLSTEGLPVELESLGAAYNATLSRLQESFERLSRFSSDIAHELRTPLSNMRIAAEVALTRERSPDHYSKVLADNIEECDRVTDVVNRLLFLAQAEHPESALSVSTFDLRQTFEKVREFYELDADEAGVTITVEDAPPLAVSADAMLIQRAVSNLVANALRYTPRGGSITLSASAQAGLVRALVADSGCGVAAEHIPFVFDRLYRVDPSRSSSAGGVGLGLAIVASVARMHGGRAWMESMPGRGTRVYLELPASRTPSDLSR